MGSKHGSYGLSVCLAIVTMTVLSGFTKADVNKDKEQCGDKLVALAPCLSYVSGESKAPPSKGCCTGLKEVVERSKVCFCILVKDHNDPSLKLKINDTLALGLPEACQVTGNITQCISLLHLKSGSPDAKMFEDYDKALHNRTNTPINPHQPERI
nr:protein YLS3-like [Tanacetum cinerariifolium]